MWWKQREALVEFGIARFVTDQKITVEEPLALISIMRHFESKFYSLEASVRYGYGLQDNKGTAFEDTVLLVLTRLLQNERELRHIFQFHGVSPSWARCKAQIVARKSSGDYEAFAIDRPFIPTATFAFSAQSAQDVEHWLRSGEAGWCIPGNLMGPDLMARLRLSDGRILLLVIKAKCHSSGNIDTVCADVTAHAIRSLIPANFFRSVVCSHLGILRDPLLTCLLAGRQV